jgi:hypothetical protein
MYTHSVPEAVDGGMIDYDAINRRIGSLRESQNQERRKKAERTEMLIPDFVPMRSLGILRMAERPVFIPAPESHELVRELFLPLKWHSGFAQVQKEKNIVALHEAAGRRAYTSTRGSRTSSSTRTAASIAKQEAQHCSYL